MSKPSNQCCFYCNETKFANRAEAQASLQGPKNDSTRIKNESSMCHRLGPITRNPFFNYVRHLRETTCAKSITDLAKQAGAEWRKMSDMEKCPFVMEAHRAPRMRRRRLRLNHSNISMNNSSMLHSTMRSRVTKKLRSRNSLSKIRRSMTNLSGLGNISAIKRSPR